MFCSTKKILSGKNPHLMIHKFGESKRTGWFKFIRQCTRCGIVETESGLI